jgi:MFS family permease
VGLAVIAASSSLAPAIVGACLAGLGTALMFPSLALLLLERVEPERRASAIGGFSAFLDIGVAVSGPLSGALAAAVGYELAFGVAAVLAAGAAVAVVAGPPASRPAVAAPAAAH